MLFWKVQDVKFVLSILLRWYEMLLVPHWKNVAYVIFSNTYKLELVFMVFRTLHPECPCFLGACVVCHLTLVVFLHYLRLTAEYVSCFLPASLSVVFNFLSSLWSFMPVPTVTWNFLQCILFADVDSKLHKGGYILVYSSVNLLPAPCGFQGCKKRPAPFPDQMS